ncbi:MlaD family protein [Geothrix sp. 21YS21S-2]|uniref:MlaD family protein n=1 Tax=Geothrix sp. 21YS21S-2 TaxID=3068893 RepID=UPI0027BAA922|nr:MlaD family protein [Geothrix sp. 21YS21S-2]
MSMKLETKVGAFFVASIGVLGILILRMEKLELFAGNGQNHIATSFAQVAGLSLQSKVRVAGVPVGAVTTIELQGKTARVVLSLPHEFKLYKDASASLSSIGILGEKYIELDPGHPEAGALPTDGTIPSKAGMGMDTIMESIGSISQDVKSITGALNKSIGGEEGRMKLDEIVDNIRVLTAEFRAMSQENHGAINATMANVQQMSSELRERLPRLAQQFEDLGKNLNAMVNDGRPELNGILKDVHKLSADLHVTVDNVNQITGKMNRGEGTIGKLLNDETTVQKINLAVDNVNSMLGGWKSMDLNLDLNAARWTKRGDSKVGIGIDIVPARDHWYALELSSTPDGKISDSTHTATIVDPKTGLPTQVPVSERTINVDQAFTVSAQFAKRLAENYVFTAGLVEGKGGVGAEFRAFNDRFRFGGVAYDFTKRADKPNPRYRLSTSYQFYKGFYAMAGLQDIANSDLRTFFVGGGIRWKDEDLKKLVGLASVGK